MWYNHDQFSKLKKFRNNQQNQGKRHQGNIKYLMVSLDVAADQKQRSKTGKNI